MDVHRLIFFVDASMDVSQQLSAAILLAWWDDSRSRLLVLTSRSVAGTDVSSVDLARDCVMCDGFRLNVATWIRLLDVSAPPVPELRGLVRDALVAAYEARILLDQLARSL